MDHNWKKNRRGGGVSRCLIIPTILGAAQLASSTSLLAGQSEPPAAIRTVKAHRLNAPPLLDGRVDKDWLAFEPARDFVQQLPEEGLPATEPTEARIGYTKDAIYFAVICFDSQPSAIVSTQGRRDGVLEQTDAFQILIDTYNDDQNGYIFATTAAGIEYDAQIVHGGQTRQIGGPPRAGQSTGSGTAGAQAGGISSFNLNWDGVWRVRTQITDRGWEAEFEIPLRTLRFNSGGNQAWGLNFMRNLRRKNEQSFWSPVPRAFDIQRVSLAGEMRGVEAKFRRSLQIIPFILGGVQQDYTHDPAVKKYEPEVGLDAKYTLTSSLTLDLTVNTDFAQVEVDEEQVNLTRFDLFFPEKRPFFLENSGYFTVGTPQEVEMFFSRRIGIDPTGAQIPIVGAFDSPGNRGVTTSVFSICRQGRCWGWRRPTTSLWLAFPANSVSGVPWGYSRSTNRPPGRVPANISPTRPTAWTRISALVTTLPGLITPGGPRRPAGPATITRPARSRSITPICCGWKAATLRSAKTSTPKSASSGAWDTENLGTESSPAPGPRTTA